MLSKYQQTWLKHLEQQSLFAKASELAIDYTQTLCNRAAYPTAQALEKLSNFDISFPQQGIDSFEVLDNLKNWGNDNTVPYTSSRYFGFVNGGTLPIGAAASVLATSWDQNAALYVMSPIAAKLEQVCEDWLRTLFSLPHGTVAGLVGGTSVATLCGLAAARHCQYEKLGWDLSQHGMCGAPLLRIIMGTQTHGTVVKMLSLLGFGQNQIEWIPCDPQGRMCVDALPKLDEHCILILQAGNVCSGAFDDFSSIIPRAEKAGAWVHVDGAFGMWAKASSQFVEITRNIERADSWSVDGHKTLNTPYDCGVILCKHPQALTLALQQQGSYIQASEQRDSMVFTPDMSRRARGIELWACLASLGQQGISELLALLHQHANDFALGAKDIGFDVLNDVVFNQVILSTDSDQRTLKILRFIQASGEAWCGGAKWHGRQVIRISICSWATTLAGIQDALQVFAEAFTHTSESV